MAKSQPGRCKWCHRRSEDGVTISRTGQCTECSTIRMHAQAALNSASSKGDGDGVVIALRVLATFTLGGRVGVVARKAGHVGNLPETLAPKGFGARRT